jgi:hypothetical protein
MRPEQLEKFRNKPETLFQEPFEKTLEVTPITDVMKPPKVPVQQLSPALPRFKKQSSRQPSNKAPVNGVVDGP